VNLLAAVLSDVWGACSDWEGALAAKAETQTCLRANSAEVVPQTGLDFRAVVTPAAGAQQHDGEREGDGTSQPIHGLDIPAVGGRLQAGKREASVYLPIVGERVDAPCGRPDSPAGFMGGPRELRNSC
jgi:hypothetical protein